LNTGLSIHRFL